MKFLVMNKTFKQYGKMIKYFQVLCRGLTGVTIDVVWTYVFITVDECQHLLLPYVYVRIIHFCDINLSFVVFTKLDFRFL